MEVVSPEPCWECHDLVIPHGIRVYEDRKTGEKTKVPVITHMKPGVGGEMLYTVECLVCHCPNPTMTKKGLV